MNTVGSHGTIYGECIGSSVDLDPSEKQMEELGYSLVKRLIFWMMIEFVSFGQFS